MVVFIDPVCPAPYSRDTLAAGALGGTEATVVRIAEGMDAAVAQHCRRDNDSRYVAYDSIGAPTHLVVLRQPSTLIEWHQRCPAARKFLWLHDLVVPGTRYAAELARFADELRAMDATLLCVSQFHRNQALAALAWHGAEAGRVRVMYNPVADEVVRAPVDVDPYKLVFASQPRKGLDFTLMAFAHLRARDERYRLVVANPGYRPHEQRSQAGVIWAGALPHARVLEEMASALCVFYPNFHYPETFGLVFAESNALGTPVLTYDIGAAREVLMDSRQLLTLDPRLARAWRWSRRVPRFMRSALIAAGSRHAFELCWRSVSAWSAGDRPQVALRPEFRLANVLADWQQLLDEPTPATRRVTG